MFSPKVHFKMDTLYKALKVVYHNCFMASIDLKDAYYSVRIANSDKKYLPFYCNDTLFQYTCLPNGLSCAPRKSTKLLKPVLSALHRKGFTVLAYIDNLLLLGDTYDDCKNNITESCGFQKLQVSTYIQLSLSLNKVSKQFSLGSLLTHRK